MNESWTSLEQGVLTGSTQETSADIHSSQKTQKKQIIRPSVSPLFESSIGLIGFEDFSRNQKKWRHKMWILNIFSFSLEIDRESNNERIVEQIS
jgi:hypothetical protein